VLQEAITAEGDALQWNPKWNACASAHAWTTQEIRLVVGMHRHDAG